MAAAVQGVPRSRWCGCLLALAVTGGEGFTSPRTDISVSSAAPEVAVTGKLPAGTCYVSAAATLIVGAGDGFGLCWIAKGSAPAVQVNAGDVSQEGQFTVAETAAVQVKAGDTLVEVCETGGARGSIAAAAGIIAIGFFLPAAAGESAAPGPACPARYLASDTARAARPCGPASKPRRASSAGRFLRQQPGGDGQAAPRDNVGRGTAAGDRPVLLAGNDCPKSPVSQPPGSPHHGVLGPAPRFSLL